MIKLEVQEYCHGCRDFESDTHYDYAGEINNIAIFCKHHNKCAQLKQYIEKNNLQLRTSAEAANAEIAPVKSYELCDRCEYGVMNRCNKARLACGPNVNPCVGCPQYIGGEDNCRCVTVKLGSGCKYFKRYEKKESKHEF